MREAVGTALMAVGAWWLAFVPIMFAVPKPIADWSLWLLLLSPALGVLLGIAIGQSLDGSRA